MFRPMLFAVVGAAVLSMPALAQEADAPLQAKLIRDNVYWVPGGKSASNSGVIVGKDGVTVVDIKATPDQGKALQDAIAKVTDKPIRQIILTDSGGHGVNGLAAFPKSVTLIAHTLIQQDLKDHMASGKNAPARIADKVVNGQKTLLTLNGERMVLIQMAPSHIKGESSIYLPDQRVVFTGMVLQSKPDFPIIHPNFGGSAFGWIQQMKTLIALDADTYVLGGGETLWTKADMQARLDAQEAVVKQIRDLVAAGKSRDEVRQALGTDKAMGGKGPQDYFFSEVAYDEIVKGAGKKS